MENQDIISEYIKTFKKSELDFAKEIQKAGNVSHSTESENMREHWDLKLELKFDVKAIKKINRQDEQTNENIHWAEIFNVNGKKGWVYSGEPNLYFAFETDDYWIIVPKKDLQDLIKKKCKKEYVSYAKDALYKLYKRKGRNDILTMVKTIDLMRISIKILDKN